MKKIGSLCIVIITLLVILSGCFSNNLAASFSEEKISNKTKMIIELLNEAKYAEVVANFSRDLQNELDTTTLSENLEPIMSQVGAFEEYKSETIVGKKLADNSDYAVDVIVCDYKNSNLTFTISFDTNMDVIGLYVK